jgi:hypothetical protein
MGYCPLHRHPDLVDFIESLSCLYGGALIKCLSTIDFDAVKAAANSPRCEYSTKPHCTMMDYNYQTFILDPALKIVNGMRGKSLGFNQKFWHVECKGTIPLPLVG